MVDENKKPLSNGEFSAPRLLRFKFSKYNYKSNHPSLKNIMSEHFETITHTPK